MIKATKSKRIYMDKIVSLDEFARIRKEIEGTVVLTGGAYDIFHYGHVRALYKASTFGDVLVVHVDSNTEVKMRKGCHRPVFEEKFRCETVASLAFVDFVFIHDGPSYSKKIINSVKPNLFERQKWLNRTEDQIKKISDNFHQKYPFCKMVFHEPTPGISTTKIIEYINENNIS